MGKAVDYWKIMEQVCEAHPKGRPYKLDENGRELGFMPDPTPHAPPLGQANVADIDMFEVMRARIRNEASIMAQMAGAESFEEAEDFEVEDDFEPFSPWEEIFEQHRPDGRVINAERPPAAPTDPLVAEGGPTGGARAPTQEPPQAAPPATQAPSK